MKEDSILTTYMQRLRWCLASLPADERDDILAEVRSHLHEKLESGVRVEEAVAGLGAAEDFARAFIAERAMLRALSTRDSKGLLQALTQRAGKSFRTIFAVTSCTVCWALAIVIVAAAVAKLFDPRHVGLWIGAGQFFVGGIDDPARGREVLGFWVFPLAFLALFLARLISRRLSVWALRPLAQTAFSLAEKLK